MDNQEKDAGLARYYKEDSQATRMVQTYKDLMPDEFVPNGAKHRPHFVFNSGKEDIHRVEFILWKRYWICNAEINGVWHTNSYPNTESMIEFLASAQMHLAKNWPVGRKYTNE